MSSLIKYEFRKSYKPYTIGIIIVISLYAYILARINTIDFMKYQNPETYENFFEGLFTVAPAVTYFAILGIGTVVLFIYGITYMSNDLFKDNAYLIHSVPQPGYNIVGSKLIVAVIQMAIWVILMFLTFTHIFSTGISKAPIPIKVDIFAFLVNNVNIVILMMLMFIGTYAGFLITVYFCFALNKSILAHVKYHNLLSTGIFFALVIIMNKIVNAVTRVFTLPVKIPFDVSNIRHFMSMENVHLDIPPSFNLDIAPAILFAAIYIVLFIYTSKLVEERINL